MQKIIIKRIFFIIWIIITALAVLIVLYMTHQIIGENSQLIGTIVNNPVNISRTSTNNLSYSMRDIKIYVISESGECLHPIDTQIEWKNTYEENCKQILNKMKTLQTNDYLSLIPDGINIRGVYLTPEGDVLIDLPATITTVYKDKSTIMFESLMTYSIVNTLLQNDLIDKASVKQIRFLIEGSLPSTEFPAHISWKEPLTPDYSFICSK